MGCRPSRRAVACVRVAGEGPWGSGRSNRPRSLTGDSGVKLRRGSRRSRDEGRDESGGGVQPRDRYSAPPVDRQFPPHSCTSAVYNHGCCGTSRITLRLSKNGSTLEIEKCDFQHGVKSCQLCGTAEEETFERSYSDVPLRAQSAPNLSMTTTSDHRLSGNKPPSFSHHGNRQVVRSEPHPPPPPVRHMNRLAPGTRTSVVSSPESVCTATHIDVDVESIVQPSSSIDSSFHIDALAYHTGPASHNSPRNPTTLEQLHFAQHSQENLEAFSNSHVLNGYEDTYSCPYSPSSEELSRLLRDADTLLMNDYNVDLEVIDLTKINSSNSGTQHEDDSEGSDIECPNTLDVSSSSVVDKIKAFETSGHANADSINELHSQTDDAQEISVLLQDYSDRTFTADSCLESSSSKDDQPYTHGATDYRVRMLGAQKNVITSQLAIKGVTKVSDGNMILASCNNTEPEEDSRISPDLNNDSVVYDASGFNMVNGGEEVLLTALPCRGSEIAGMTTIAVKVPQHSDKQTDRNCVQNREGKRQRRLPGQESAPLFYYADVQNDSAEDTVDNSSPGLHSLC